MLKKKSLFDSYKISVALLGSLFFVFAAVRGNSEIFNWQFAGYMLFTIIVTSQMSFTVPRSKFFLSFSDSMVFLTFLLYGGQTAIIIAAAEAVSTCLFAKYNGMKFSRFSIIFNIGASILSISFTCLIFYTLEVPLRINPDNLDTANLISTLGILALSQFIFISFFASIFYALKNDASPWQLWKSECYSISLMQIISAGLAGVAFKLISLENVIAIVIALAVFTVLYFTYRRSNKDLAVSIEKTERAEQERAEQAEQHVEELQIRLATEEKLGKDLQFSNEALERSARHDALTDLYNRSYLIERLELLFELGIKDNSSYYLLFIDLSRFKNINDSLGHNIGDKVLKLVAQRLLRTVNEEDTVTRIGGDEFAIILNNLSSVKEAEKYAGWISQKLASPFSVLGNRIFTKANIGIAPLDSTYKTPEEILRDADIAMHYAKEKEIGSAVFNTEIRDRFLEKINLESDLRGAIENKEFSMHYQPIVTLQNGSLIGFEALLRWQHPRRGFIPPFEFIPIAEDSGLIIPITEWILRETTDQLAEWHKISRDYENLIVSVNISGKHLVQDGLVGEVKKVLNSSGISSRCLKLEITESVAMENAERTIVILNKLKKLGVKLSIDDFGTGYSSLSYLHRLPFDTLKIDRSFVNTVSNDGENAEILQTIISLAKNLKMEAIAEGIETEKQLQILRDLGCSLAQGYLFSKPLPKEEMEKHLYQKHTWFPKSILPENFNNSETLNGNQSNSHLPIF